MLSGLIAKLKRPAMPALEDNQLQVEAIKQQSRHQEQKTRRRTARHLEITEGQLVEVAQRAYDVAEKINLATGRSYQ